MLDRFRRPALAGLPLACLLFAVPPAGLIATPAAAQSRAQQQRDTQAEAFVNLEANRALQILNDTGAGVEARKRAFRAFVDRAADVPRITGFVLGKYRRSVSGPQYAEFAQVFRQYANNVYESRLGEYHGEKLTVTGSTVRQPGDVVVSSQVIGGRVRQPVMVDWRVIRGGDGQYRVVDVSVAGVWLAITQQQDFVSTLDNHGGDVGFLIAQLRSQIATSPPTRR